MRPLELVFHPKETCFPTRCFRTRFDDVFSPLDAKRYRRAETYQFVYEENPAIGLCGLFPRSACLGYHTRDVERITYFYDDGDVLKRVVISAHDKEHDVIDVDHKERDVLDVDHKGRDALEPITVYVAKGSHAFYGEPGVHWRIMGFANDICRDGKRSTITESDVEELVRPVVTEFGFTVEPTCLSPDRILSKWQRFWIPFAA